MTRIEPLRARARWARHLGVVALGWLAALPLAACFAADGESVRVVVKFVKTAGGPPVQFATDSCPACKLVLDPNFDRDNRRETLVALDVPARRTLELRFRAPPGGIRRVILETGDLRFRAQGDVLTVELPPTHYSAVMAGEMATHIVEPGMVLRFEHADPERRAGAYGAALPYRQRQAADHLEFAQREVIRATGLGEYVASGALGVIFVMGFDTNNPHGHTDAPPHMHMHMRWPNHAGTQIGHYYIDESGLLLRNEIGIKDLGGDMVRNVGRGQAFTTVDFRGVPAYTHTITPEGWLQLGRANQAPCLIRPDGVGFDTGAVVECPGRQPVTIHVTDDLQAGVLRVTTDAVNEIFRYDPDTGKLLSAGAPPPVSESSYRPADW